MTKYSWIDAAGAAMWALVGRYTGHVGYERGVKAGGLNDDLPVIDCSGWTALLLSTGMAAANREAWRLLFTRQMRRPFTLGQTA